MEQQVVHNLVLDSPGIPGIPFPAVIQEDQVDQDMKVIPVIPKKVLPIITTERYVPRKKMGFGEQVKQVEQVEQAEQVKQVKQTEQAEPKTAERGADGPPRILIKRRTPPVRPKLKLKVKPV